MNATQTSRAQKSNPGRLVEGEFSPFLPQRWEIQSGHTKKKEKIEKHVVFRI